MCKEQLAGMAEFLFKDTTFSIIGICMEVHRILGPGLKEINYKDAMTIEFQIGKMPYRREQKFKIVYKDQVLKNTYDADFIIDDKIILEIKASAFAHPQHEAQTLGYLAASGLRVALLINFGQTSLIWKRIVL